MKLQSAWTLENAILPVEYQIDSNSSDYEGYKKVREDCGSWC